MACIDFGRVSSLFESFKPVKNFRAGKIFMSAHFFSHIIYFGIRFLEFHKKIEVHPLLYLNTYNFYGESLAHGLLPTNTTAKLSEA